MMITTLEAVSSTSHFFLATNTAGGLSFSWHFSIVDAKEVNAIYLVMFMLN